MGSMKEHMMELEQERFETWAAAHYPDIAPDSPEWEQIGNYYYWDQQAQEVQCYEEILLTRHQEDLRDRTSLDNIELRFRHAMRELDELDALLARRQVELIWRMGIIHSVSVMDAFFMYCARALLNHDWPLRRFRDTYYFQSRRFNNSEKQKAAEMEITLFRPVARLVVSKMTFQNPVNIEKYFATVLHFPCDWPLYPLKGLTELRNDLSHRNGYTRTGSKVVVCSHDLRNAVSVVRNIIDTAMASLRLEEAFFSNSREEGERISVASMIGSGSSSGEKS